MPFITVDLLRKRAEHNEGCLSNLKEIALHQQDLEQISVVGDVCRELEILYLCNNYIPRIEGLVHLKYLKYLNLAINNIKVIEGLEGCEVLEKLDLTLNFIEDVRSVTRLRANIHLQSLHLTGNPCTNVAGYRDFVLHALPQLTSLDSEDVVPSALIKAKQGLDDAVTEIVDDRMKAREQERLDDELRAQGIDPNPPRFDDKGERLYGHSAEERIQMLRDQEEKDKQRKEEEARAKEQSPFAGLSTKPAAPVRLTVEEELAKHGRLLMRNEGKVGYTMVEERDDVVVEVEVGKFIATSSIQIDLQVTYARIEIKGKLLQLVFPLEIVVEKAKVERAAVNGKLKLTLPIAKNVLVSKAVK
eukprot:PhM_4_TR11580/c0_g1_i1/m.81972/K19753/LRRC6; protein TilB